MELPDRQTALRYHRFGPPAETLVLDTVPIPRPGPGQVLMRMLAAPINPADMGRIGGSYGDLPDLPAVGGLEGVGEIADLGDRVKGWRLGDRVLAPPEAGSWQAYALADAENLYLAPPNADLHQAAMARVNPPTAWLMLRQFEKLEPGNWIAQNAASSAVGKLVIQFAARQGLRCACLVRSTETAPRLRELGADAVFADDADASESALSATGGERPKLALNAVGGPSAYALAKMLAPGGTHVTYGGMTRELAPFPTRQLIFDDIRLRGFWVSEWYRRAPRSEVEATLDEIYCACEIANVATDIEAVYRLDQWQKALKRAVKPGKTGKVLFDMEAA